MSEHTDLLRDIATGLTYEERFGGWAGLTHTNYNARVVAESVLEACVRHPEWAMGAAQEMRAIRGDRHEWLPGLIEERVEALIHGAFVERRAE